MPWNSLLTTSLLQNIVTIETPGGKRNLNMNINAQQKDCRFDSHRGQVYFLVSDSEYCNTVVDLPGGAGMCAPPLNSPRGGAEGMQGSANFFSSVEFYL